MHTLYIQRIQEQHPIKEEEQMHCKEERSLKIVDHLEVHFQLFETLPLVHRQRFSLVLEKLVIQGLSRTQTLLRVDFQQLGQQVLAFVGKMSGKFESTELVTLAFLRKGRLNHQHLVHQNPHAPTIYLVIIETPLSDLRTNVIQSPTKGLSLPVSLGRPPKISDLQQLSKANNVLRLQVAMHDAIPMQVIDAIEDLDQVLGSFVLIKGASPQYLLIKIVKAVLHDKEDLISANVVAVSWQNVGMLAVEMYLHLFDEEFKLDLVFLEGFECDKDVVDVGNSENDLSCLTLTQLPQHLQLVPWLLAVLQIRYFLEGFVHVLQLLIDVEILLKVLIVQPHRDFV